MTRKYFGTDGIRGRVGEGPISADFVLRLGNAYGHALREAGMRPDARAGGQWRKPLVVIGKDTRISNYMFEAALEAGLVAAGVDVQLMGPMPTPAVSHLTRSLGADGGTYFIPELTDAAFTLQGHAGVSAVPEPATWAMLITGFGLAGSVLRSRRRQVLA